MQKIKIKSFGARLDLCVTRTRSIFSPLDFNPARRTINSDIPPSTNCVKINSCAGCLLVTLKVGRRENCTESE